MPSQPVRLILAADLRLGSPLRTSIPLTESARQIVLDSTYLAWERLILEAVDREVDFVILNGNTFVASDWSYRSEECLRAGFQTLRDAEIHVVAVPGPEDPFEAWKVFDDLELQVFSPDLSGWETVVGTSGCVLCELLRIDEEVATDARDLNGEEMSEILRVMLSPSRELIKERPLPKGIDLAIHAGEVVWRRDNATDFLSLGCRSPQAAFHHADSQGVVYLDSNQDRQIRASRLETAAVGFATFELDLTGIDSRDDAALLMQSHLEDRNWSEAERVRLAVWDVAGESPLAYELLDGPGESPLLEVLHELLSLPEDVHLLHEFRADVSRSEVPSTERHSPELAEQILHALNQDSTSRNWDELLDPVFESSRISDSTRSAVTRQLNPQRIACHSTAVVRRWLIETHLEDPKSEDQTHRD
jgi:hypothetical protein